MAKEMIISSSAHEKKIAIIEDGIVTEYYVERSDESQGVAGNIYKGRVMKVLPGMQSAFVDIGLERDAFLYVSDFFEEEGLDEFESVDVKSREESVSKPAEEKFVEKIAEKATETPVDRHREHLKHYDDTSLIEEAQAVDEEVEEELEEVNTETTPEVVEEITEVLTTTETADTVSVVEIIEAPVVESAPVSDLIRIQDDELPITVSTPTPVLEPPPEDVLVVIPEPVVEVAEEVEGKKRRSRTTKKKPAATAKKRSNKRAAQEVKAETSLERIVDEEAEEVAGELLKDAIVQQKIVEEIRRAEYETPVEEPPESPHSTQTSLYRIMDEEIAPVTEDEDLGPVATDGGTPLPNKAKASHRANYSNREFSSRRGGRRRGRRAGGSRPSGSGEEASLTPEKSEGGAATPAPSGRQHQHSGISELLHEGQEIIVQIAKEPIALKGARITSHIALPGRYLVYMPTINHIGVSRKISSDAERSRLKKIILSLKEKERPQGGFIVRTACEGHTEQELYDDLMYLVRTWQDIRRKSERTKAPSLICRELDLVQRSLRDLLSDEFTAIRVDNETEYARIIDFVNRFQPKLVNRVKLYTKRKPIFEEYGVQEELDKAIKPRVWLRSGGYIVINQTEALVAIDVNTGKFVGRSNRLEDTITKTNLEAVKEIVRQIRLRDLGGIIVLDLIDMEERKNRQKVMQALEAELKADRSPSKVLQFNDFGLVAITRKRVRQSLERTLCSPCPYCEGAGLVKSPQTVCYEILADAKRIAAESEIHPGTEVILRINSSVAEALRGSERKVLSEIEAYFGTSITIKGDASVHQERYDFAII